MLRSTTHGRGTLPGHFQFLPWLRRLRLLAVLGFALLPAVSVSTSEVVVFGPQTYVRDTGAPITVPNTFHIDHSSGTFTLRLWNHGVTSAVISVNGQVVLGPADFKGGEKDGALLERAVAVTAGSNVIAVELRSKPGSSVVVEIVGVRIPTLSDLKPSQLTIAAGGTASLAIVLQNPDSLSDMHVALT